GGGRCAGRVEVKHGGEWGSVCVYDFDWEAHWAIVVCRQLGCGRVAKASPYAPFGQGTGRIWLQPFCLGTEESTLWDCGIRGWGPYNYSHERDTAVTCQGFSRLVGGDGACAGRLEVRQGRAWVGVCEDQVDMKVAQVVCRELGCGAALSIPGSERFGAGSGPLWDGGFQCNGTEPLLSACARHRPHSQGCSTGPASVICSPYTGFRLGNSSSGCTGRVEVAVRGTWGSVCASEWELADVHVLCRHLGCGRAFTVPPGGSFGSGDGPLRPDAFGCSGSERHPGECPVAVLGKPPCAPGNAAAVNCSGVYGTCGRCMKGFWDPQEPGVEDAGMLCSRRVRLVGSSGRCAGRVEVYSGGTWSAVCQEGWELRDAAVVCRELGCGTALEAPSWARFGAGPGPLWPYIPACSGSEESLWECGRSEGRECGRGGGAGAVCSEQLSVRLAGGRGRCRGFLEVSHNGTWGRVCADGTSPGTANTVCQQLGCGPRGWLSAVPAQQPAPAWLAWVGCEDGARSLWGCPSAPWNLQSCGPGGDAHRGPRRWRARLSSLRAAGSGELRLVGGGGRCAGRVEVKHGGEWGSVCVFDFDWEARWAIVVCRQLGCGRVAKASPYAPFGQGTGRIWLQPFFCRGTEEALEECPHFGWGQHFCGHESDVGVTCRGEGTWRRWFAGSWAVERRSPSPAASDLGQDRGRSGTGACSATAPSPSSAPVPGIGPTARAAAPALPASSAPVSAGDTGGCWAPCAIAPLNALSATAYTGFRLGNSSSGCTGRVEVAVRGTWGSVCASEWELADAHVLCRHLGCGRAFTVPPGGSFGSGDGPLRPDAFGCSGSERHPGECPVAVLGKPPCAPGNAAAVNCSGVYGTCGRCMKGFWDPQEPGAEDAGMFWSEAWSEPGGTAPCFCW
uniref:Uncharacterized protein n=1 Tax=Corvus moneduloides TaxID=1196302 RepID=A0A8U7NP66_CORMO